MDFDAALDVVLKEDPIPEGFGDSGIVRKPVGVYDFLVADVVPPLMPFLK